MQFTEADKELFEPLLNATDEEKILLSKIINDKISSNLDDNCTHPYEIAKELQLMGGHSAVNLFRGHGVAYRELAYDAASKVGAKIPRSAPIEDIEWALLETLIETAMEKMSSEDRQKFYEEVQSKGFNQAFKLSDIIKQGGIAAPGMYLALAEVSMPYILRTLGLNAAAGFLGGRVIASAIPIIGWSLALGSILN